MAPFLQKRRRR
jgi:hypothetical protein